MYAHVRAFVRWTVSGIQDFVSPNFTPEYILLVFDTIILQLRTLTDNSDWFMAGSKDSDIP